MTSTDDKKADQKALNEGHLGPISLELLVDPVHIINIDDVQEPASYEKRHLYSWIEKSEGTSPLTRRPIRQVKDDNDKKKEIKNFRDQHPNAKIVKKWSLNEKIWYGDKDQQPPSPQEMNRDDCNNCCSSRGEGAIVGAACGAITGCICGMPGQGATIGAVCGAVCEFEKKDCKDLACETYGACARCIRAQHYVVGRGIRRNTIKRKQKKTHKTRKTRKTHKTRKTRKTRKHKHKRTVKKKRKEKKRKTQKHKRKVKRNV